MEASAISMFTPTVTPKVFWMSYEKKNPSANSVSSQSEMLVKDLYNLILNFSTQVPKQKFLMGDPEASFPPDRNGHDCMICAIRKAGKTEMCPKQDVSSLKEEK